MKDRIILHDYRFLKARKKGLLYAYIYHPLACLTLLYSCLFSQILLYCNIKVTLLLAYVNSLANFNFA